jgi:hypothetical protein
LGLLFVLFGHFAVSIFNKITDHSRVTVDFKKGELVFETKPGKKQDKASRRAWLQGASGRRHTWDHWSSCVSRKCQGRAGPPFGSRMCSPARDPASFPSLTVRSLKATLFQC